MNIRDYEYALAVARHGSFTRAAEHCGVSQPTLSGQIRKLERALGVELFERDGRTIRVTSAGEAILEQAHTAFEAVGKIGELARAASDPLVGPLKIGIIPTLAPYLLPLLLPIARRRLPKAPLQIVENTTPNVVAELAQGRLNAAIVATDHRSEGFDEIALFDEPFFLAVGSRHALAQSERVRLDEVDPQSLLLLSDGHCLRDQTIALCSAAGAGADLNRDVSAVTLETLIQLVRVGMGVTLVPQLARASIKEAAVTVRPIAHPGAYRQIRLLHRPFAPRRAVYGLLAGAVVEAWDRANREAG